MTKTDMLQSVQDWQVYLTTIHTLPMALGLERVRAVGERLQLLTPSYQVITIAGTNGKGSCVAGLEAIYLKAGYKVGSFTSPYLQCLNEEIKVAGTMVTDQSLIAALNKVEAARGEYALTTFEFVTLAALYVFQEANIEIALLEVGLGGRLDAVNIISADIAVITSISIDHVAWLGNSRDSIAAEKAGIFRENIPVVCGDAEPPKILQQTARALDAPFYQQDEQFHYIANGLTWDWHGPASSIQHLPQNGLLLQNMATVLMVVELMQMDLPVQPTDIQRGLLNVHILGRQQILVRNDVTVLLDVAHNPASAGVLKKKLVELAIIGKTFAVFSMLGDKDIAEVIHLLNDKITTWYIAPLNDPRAATVTLLQATLAEYDAIQYRTFDTITSAFAQAEQNAQPGDTILVFGSFHTVGEVLTALSL